MFTKNMGGALHSLGLVNKLQDAKAADLFHLIDSRLNFFHFGVIDSAAHLFHYRLQFILTDTNYEWKSEFFVVPERGLNKIFF